MSDVNLLPTGSPKLLGALGALLSGITCHGPSIISHPEATLGAVSWSKFHTLAPGCGVGVAVGSGPAFAEQVGASAIAAVINPAAIVTARRDNDRTVGIGLTSRIPALRHNLSCFFERLAEATGGSLRAHMLRVKPSVLASAFGYDAVFAFFSPKCRRQTVERIGPLRPFS